MFKTHHSSAKDAHFECTCHVNLTFICKLEFRFLFNILFVAFCNKSFWEQERHRGRSNYNSNISLIFSKCTICNKAFPLDWSSTKARFWQTFVETVQTFVETLAWFRQTLVFLFAKARQDLMFFRQFCDKILHVFYTKAWKLQVKPCVSSKNPSCENLASPCIFETVSSASLRLFSDCCRC